MYAYWYDAIQQLCTLILLLVIIEVGFVLRLFGRLLCRLLRSVGCSEEIWNYDPLFRIRWTLFAVIIN